MALFLCLFALSIVRHASAEPTGTIAFLSSRNSKPPHKGATTTVYLINADGTNERKWLENPSGRSFGSVAWSPDGKFVAWSRFNDRIESHLFVMELRTGKQKNITARWREWGMDFFKPDWSGDGKRLALVCIPRDEVRGNICIIKVDGEGLEQLTNEPDKRHSNPSWSPDGKKIAFNGGGIFVIDRNGRNRVNPNPWKSDQGPAWSPDGTKIAFYSNRDNLAQEDIYVMNADGANVVRLTDHPSPDRLPAWSPDGQWIAFMSTREARWDIYIIDANGGKPMQVTTHPDNDTHPTWVIPLAVLNDYFPLLQE